MRAEPAFGLTMIVIVSCVTHPGGILAAGANDAVSAPEIAILTANEVGAWRTKTQQVFDPVRKTLIRRPYSAWDGAPSKDLDFFWVANSLRDDREGRLNGAGHLIWRSRGMPAYDHAAAFSEFRGRMLNGRADGHGSYFDRTGASYEGGWKNGMPQGHGTLKLPTGAEFTGLFRAGRAHGAGRYVDAAGEIFEGRFIDGLRDGRGTTTLPNGNTYRSDWRNGMESEGSRSIRLAQAGGAPVPGGGTDELAIGILVDRRAASYGLQYTYANEGSRIAIKPDDKVVMAAWKGGVIHQGREGGSDLWDGNPVTLQLVIQNKSAKAIQVMGAEIQVMSSATDLQPTLEVGMRSIADKVRYQRGDSCRVRDFAPRIYFTNYGWGAAEQTTMRFAFAMKDQKNRPASFKLSKPIGRIDQQATIDLEPDLRAAGVNTDAIRQSVTKGLNCKSASMSACLQEVKQSRVFGSLAEHVTVDKEEDGSGQLFLGTIGQLAYTWNDSKGQSKQTTSSFPMQKIRLGSLKGRDQCAEGGDRETISAKGLNLRLDQTQYRLPVAFRGSIPPSQLSRLTVQLQAEKTSEHDFHVVLKLSDGREVSSRPINLLFYLPRTPPG